MSSTIVVAHDGSDSSERAMAFAVDRAGVIGGAVLVAHVLEWSPYAFLTKEELEERHVRRREELERAEAALLRPVLERHAASGVPITTEMRYGHVAETLIRIATQAQAVQVVIGRRGQGGFANRFFGSVAGSLVQACPVPLTIVP
ncbi:universal stress protein [Mangrovicoccus algicola]|uniref:Universal stress protein n=1 Tax=Mangrovicoccus algicola TaxID=2771008 RepID=A0A8J6ZAP0_9RHOB|nr:universal stress protein [Mangrovicoccus algicola]MBE3639485.1 universal stress protein [Mangrovicoccus algicola]